MASYVNPRSYSLADIQTEVPQSSVSGIVMKPIPSNNHVVRTMSSSGDSSLGGSCSIRVPSSQNSSIKTYSAYLQFQVQVSLPINAAAEAWNFSNNIKGASSLIQKITLSSGSTIETLDNYARLHSLIIRHSTNESYLKDLAIQEMAANVWTHPILAAATTATFTVCVPIVSGLLCAGVDIPLYLMSAGLQVDINWAPNTLSCTKQVADGTNVSGITMKNVCLVYESIQHDDAFCQGQRAFLAEKGGFFSIPFATYNTFQKTSEASLAYSLGLNKLSVFNVLYTTFAAKTAVINDLQKSAAMTKFEVYVDNNLVNMCGDLSVATNPSLVFCELQRAMSALQDITVTTSATLLLAGGAIPYVYTGTYLTDFFAAGISLKRVSEGFNMSGTPVKSLDLRVEQTVVAGDISFIAVGFHNVLNIDMSGGVNLVN